MAKATKKKIMKITTPSGNLIGYEVGTTMYYVTRAPNGFWILNVSTPIANKVVSRHRAFATAIRKAKSRVNKLVA